MYGISPGSGYFNPIPLKISRGPWFKEFFATDDGLEYYYRYSDEEGKTKYLLTNNIPWQDRESIERLYNGVKRTK